MMVEEGTNIRSNISATDRSIWLTIISSGGTTKTGATTQSTGVKASAPAIAALSDQSVGQVGAIVEEWNPEKFSRMCHEW